jgi:hypothetical protein
MGFKSVYNITDVPSLLSDHHLLFMNPFEDFTTNPPGYDPSTISVPLESLSSDDLNLDKDQYEPLQAAARVLLSHLSSLSIGEYDTKTPYTLPTSFPGTLFRLPLRTSGNDLCSESTSVDRLIDELLRPFYDEINLLFLQSVTSITVLTVDDHDNSSDDDEPIIRPIWSMQMSDEDAHRVRLQRRAIITNYKNMKDLSSPSKPFQLGGYPDFDAKDPCFNVSSGTWWLNQKFSIRSCYHDNSGHDGKDGDVNITEYNDVWITSQGVVVNGPLDDMAMKQLKFRQLPLASVAILFERNGQILFPLENTTVSCTLPLPLMTHLPVMVFLSF